jgi:hypothetical protein
MAAGSTRMKTIFLFAILVFQAPIAAQSDPFIATIEHAKLSIIPVACSSSIQVTLQTITILGDWILR